MGVNGCQTRENELLRKLDEQLLLACTAQPNTDVHAHAAKIEVSPGH